MRYDLRGLALAVEGEEVMQTHTGARPGQHNHQQVPADNQHTHRRKGKQHGAHEARLVALATEVARGVVDDDPAEHRYQNSHREPQGIYGELLELRPGQRSQRGTERRQQSAA